jgi:hypothetical protein
MAALSSALGTTRSTENRASTRIVTPVAAEMPRPLLAFSNCLQMQRTLCGWLFFALWSPKPRSMSVLSVSGHHQRTKRQAK